LTALAQMTSRIRIGCMVNGMHFRHPAVTANMAASLDIVANGRLDLGLGAGWFEMEAQSLGFELGTIRQRMDRFDEGVEVVARLLSQDTTTFSGAFYQLDEARCEPKGQQEPHPPIVIGGQGERRTLRTVAKWAQMWDALMIGPEDWTRKREVLLSHCSEVGRDPAEITCSAHVPWSKEAGPAEPVERAAQLIAAGIDVVVFTMRAPYDVSMLEPMTAELAQLA
ncbi:MAG: LLM class flavin-dependent oxidoreductase, partial [Acidimicrobiia bacterium]|nr:LLM class flavin-dependent oxidoreductase [Acidimicrobiia bacterium]